MHRAQEEREKKCDRWAAGVSLTMPMSALVDYRRRSSALSLSTPATTSLRHLLLVVVTDPLQDGSDHGVDVLDVVGGLTVADEVMHDTSDETANREGLVVN